MFLCKPLGRGGVEPSAGVERGVCNYIKCLTNVARRSEHKVANFEFWCEKSDETETERQ